MYLLVQTNGHVKLYRVAVRAGTGIVTNVDEDETDGKNDFGWYRSGLLGGANRGASQTADKQRYRQR